MTDAGATAGRTPTPLDELDRGIVRLLQRNGRLTNTEVGRALNVTETTIRKRVNRMVDEGLMQVVAVPTPLATGQMTSAIIGISVQLKHLQEVAGALSQRAEVRYCGMSVGRYDIVLEAVFADQEHLLRFVSEELGALDGIVSVETSIILKIDKFSYEWELP
jgi:Lrp/AsnC family transcriptional regulator for asnA, asnC and gidA